jgi:uncharacterized protein
MEKIELTVVTVSTSQSQLGTYALILDEKYGTRRIPIIIGPYEAQAIVFELEQMKPERPFTHDLFRSFAFAHDIILKEVIINRFINGVFFSEIHSMDKEGNMKSVDSRTSDAVALALRFHCPIFTYESIISETALQPPSQTGSGEEEEEESGTSIPLEDLNQFGLQKLEKMLEEAVASEDYELASKIRDEINRRKNTDE